MNLWNGAADMTPEERLREMATLLARGVLRLRRRPGEAGISSRPADINPAAKNSSDQGLELSAETRLSVQRG